MLLLASSLDINVMVFLIWYGVDSVDIQPLILFIGAIVRFNAYYGQGEGRIYGYSCGGRENSLSSCSRLPYYSIIGCSHYQDIGIDCEGKMVSLTIECNH